MVLCAEAGVDAAHMPIIPTRTIPLFMISPMQEFASRIQSRAMPDVNQDGNRVRRLLLAIADTDR
jgi:hypothetical protein